MVGFNVTSVLPQNFQINWLSGCVLWLRSDLGITIATGVSQWNDQSGKSNNASQSTSGQQPAYVTRDINGYPSISSNASAGTYLTFSSHPANGIITTSAAERIFVGENASDPPGGASTGDCESAWGTSGQASNIPFTDGNIYEGFATTVRKNAITHSANMANPYIFDSYSQANDWQLFLNGTNIFSTATNTFGVSSAAPVIVGNVATMKCCEYIVFNRVLTSNERTELTRYLGARYGIVVP